MAQSSNGQPKNKGAVGGTGLKTSRMRVHLFHPASTPYLNEKMATGENNDITGSHPQKRTFTL